MSLKTYFPEQFDQLKQFMISAVEVARCVRIDPEMKPMLTKALARMEDDPEFPHAFIIYTEPFTDPVQYFGGLFDSLERQFVQHAEALQERGVKFEVPFDDNSPPPAPFRFLRYAEALTEALPDQVGALMFLLDPDSIVDEGGFRRSIQFLAEKTSSRWLKFIVLDLRTTPVIEASAEPDRRIGFQTFHLSPEEIERRVREDLAAPAALQPGERRQYLGMLAGFAFARKEYNEAETMQRRWLEMAEAEGEPSEVAVALYNLGNTLIAKGAYAEATDVYCRACDLCIDNKLDGLAPMAYTNLGVSLHRQGAFEGAFTALRVARDMFKAQNHRPGEAHVAETLAQMYADDGHYDKAEQSLRYALSVYDGITSSLFKQLRDMGRANVLDKLDRLFKQSGQTAKVTKFRQAQEAGRAAD
jgi:tetratricopeptide (TPR) repeat protein